MTTFDKILSYLASVPPEYAIAMAGFGIAFYALRILHVFISGNSKK